MMNLIDFGKVKSVSRLGFLMAIALPLVGGCGESNNPLSGAKLYPVKGKVILPDGKPLGGAMITFHATKSTLTSTTKVESDGTFAFKGGSNGEGLPEGEYRVQLEADETTRAKKGTPAFPTKYLDEDGSDLVATVKPDESGNDIELKLTPNAPKSASSSRGGFGK